MVPPKIDSLAKKLVMALILLYQRTLSPDHGLFQAFFPHGACRYTPTCSEYAKEAIQKHGVMHGGSLAIQRITRCHPWGGQGHDPVPGKPSIPNY